MNSIIPVLLAGGSGKRFCRFHENHILNNFQILLGLILYFKKVLRLISSDQILFEKHITVTNLILDLLYLSNYKNLLILTNTH